MLELRSQGRDVSDEILSHISPGHSDNINILAVINVDVEAELAKLDTSGWRRCGRRNGASWG
ncbi:transposase [Nonomuraea diastatica]|uniref:transposase n=1 Tax=Nonomuraea diastatica TaxID=1848329 RepID=UPI001FE906C2|nr:transposase [Nonomuraea diastatica]